MTVLTPPSEMRDSSGHVTIGASIDRSITAEFQRLGHTTESIDRAYVISGLRGSKEPSKSRRRGTNPVTPRPAGGGLAAYHCAFCVHSTQGVTLYSSDH